MSDPAREFLMRTFTLVGGVVEDTAAGLEALLPADAARQLGLPEEVAVHLSSAEAGDGILDGRIGSSLLERLVADRLERPTLAAVALPAGLSAPLPDKLPVLLNAVQVGVPERHRTIGRFLVAEIRVTLHGEEFRSALVSLTIRLEDGARTVAFRVSGAYPVAAAPLAERERTNAQKALRSWLAGEGPAVHAVALETLRRRAVRDLERMADYYASLDAEMAKAVQRARASDERARRVAKWTALPADLDSRREQLRVRIRPRLAARMIAATLIESDVEQFVFAVRRRSREGHVTVTCRTGDGVLEGPACAACGVATLRLYLCDERLHVLCGDCGQTGRLDATRCRACRGPHHERSAITLEDPTTRLRIGAPVAPKAG